MPASRPERTPPRPRQDPDGPRYGPAVRLYGLVLRLAGAHSGLSLQEMAEHLGAGRRTAERMRDAIVDLFPQITVSVGDDRVHRWRLPTIIPPISAPSPASFATLEVLAKDLQTRGDEARAGQVREIIFTLRAMMPDAALRRAEPDIEALMAAEGSATHTGPRLVIDPDLLSVLRQAILGCHIITLDYRSADAANHTPRRLRPYGVLYGHRAYLVAEIDPGSDMRIWRLDRMRDILNTRMGFTRREFDQQAFAARAFGVFQEDPFLVRLRFSPAAAADASAWNFHPGQIVEPLADGRLLVTFQVGGIWELAWHLFTWGDCVEILEPAQLRTHLAGLAATAAAHHAAIPAPG